MAKQRSVTYVFLVILLALSGCVSDINRKEANIHFEAARRFEFQRDFISAREQYGKALIDARLAGADQATISMLTYNYGRTSGYTCHLDEAEQMLLQALEIEKSVSGPESGIYSMRLFELARLYYDKGQFEKSAEYYSQGIPVVEKLGIETSDPIGFANALSEYGSALAKIGRTAAATEALQKARKLEDANPGRKPGIVPERYMCKQ
jgi:tetratricopeptide (TPR) repeat protein